VNGYEVFVVPSNDVIGRSASIGGCLALMARCDPEGVCSLLIRDLERGIILRLREWMDLLGAEYRGVHRAIGINWSKEGF
jgi:hypothetical protein